MNDAIDIPAIMDMAPFLSADDESEAPVNDAGGEVAGGEHNYELISI